ncbi:MAG: NFYB/HAP3 family transcription factor subunit [Candidatus Aenigmarchaeota archaeon]|nr:NFYB/HAP3 family transcription factor subunit [Candidatus Aenigmarchaeota archaeon]
MARIFPLAPLERIAKKSGAQRVSASALRAIRDAVLDAAERIAADAVAASHHAGRVTVKAKDIKIACR